MVGVSLDVSFVWNHRRVNLTGKLLTSVPRQYLPSNPERIVCGRCRWDNKGIGMTQESICECSLTLLGLDIHWTYTWPNSYWQPFEVISAREAKGVQITLQGSGRNEQSKWAPSGRLVSKRMLITNSWCSSVITHTLDSYQKGRSISLHACMLLVGYDHAATE